MFKDIHFFVFWWNLEILVKYYREVIVESSDRVVMSSNEQSWALISANGHLLVCCYERSWVLLSANECPWCQGAILMSAYDCLWKLKSVHEHSLVLMSVLSVMGPCSCVFMTGHLRSRALMNTYEQPRALMSMEPLCQKNHECREHPCVWLHGTMSIMSSYTNKAPCPSVLAS